MLRKSYKQAFTGILMRGCDFLLTRKWSSEVNTSRSTQPPFLVVLYLLQCTWVIVRSCCMFLFISHFTLFFAVTDSWNFISLPEALTRTAHNTWAYSHARLNPSSATARWSLPVLYLQEPHTSGLYGFLLLLCTHMSPCWCPVFNLQTNISIQKGPVKP